MIELTEPQVWTLIGVFASVTFALVGVITSAFTRLLRAEFATMRAEFATMRAEFRGEIGALRAELGGEINSMRTEMNARFEALERDVRALMQRVFNRPA